MEKISAAIIGLGRIAGLLEDDPKREKPCTHAGAVAAGPDCFLAAGCDRDGERRRLFAERWKVPVYAGAGEMIAACRPRLVIVATHPDSHERYCRLAAAAGTPVIVCEKPLADTLGGARRIAGLERSGGVRIITNHERRYAADYLKARAILDGGKLGRLLAVNASLCMGRTKRLVDVLWHDGTHLADAIMYLSRSVMKHKKAWGAALTARSGTAWLSGLLFRDVSFHDTLCRDAALFGGDTGHDGNVAGQDAVLFGGSSGGSPARTAPRLSSGESPVPFVLQIGAGRDHLIFELEFSCERGRLRIGNGIFEVWESGESPYAGGFRSLEKTGETFEGPTGYFANMIQDAAACVRNPVRRPRSSAAAGLRVIEYLSSVKRRPFRDGRI